MEDLEREIGDDYMGPVEGRTDSERLFALITKRIDELGDVGEGIASAVGWVADHVPVYSLNLTLGTADELWALRYPDTHELFVLERVRAEPAPTSSTAEAPTACASIPTSSTTSRRGRRERAMDDHSDWRRSSRASCSTSPRMS